MPLKIKCTYAAEGEPFTLGEKYSIYCESATNSVYYIKNDLGFKLPYRHDEDGPVIDRLLDTLHAVHHSHFTPCITLEEKKERTPKEKVKILLDKAVDYIYNNQEELNISLDDFVTLVKIKEDLK